MAENISLNNVATFQNDTSAVNTVNTNNAAITTAFTDVLSRSGISPNQMGSTLDMNGNQIINLPFPTTLNSPARLVDVTSAQNITIVSATTGTSGHTVPFLDGNNTWSGTNNFNPASGLGIGYLATQNLTGTAGSGFVANGVDINSDNVNGGSSNSVIGFQVNQIFGGNATIGSRYAINGQLQLNAPTNASNGGRFYSGLLGQGIANTGDGGTSPTLSATAQGQIFGIIGQGILGPSATSLQLVSGGTFQTSISSGGSTWGKSVATFQGQTTDVVAGTGINTMLWLNNQTSAVKWNNAILIDNAGGLGSFPIAITGTILKTGAGTVTNGIDFTTTTISNAAFASPGFAISGTGAVQSGLAGTSNGTVSLNGITSGFTSIVSNSTASQLTVSSSTNSSTVQIGTVGSSAGNLTLAGLTSGSATINCSATGGNLQMGGGNLFIDSSGNIVTSAVAVIASASAIPAGGSAGTGYRFSNTTNFGMFFGSGAPTLSAAKGSLYLRSDGTSGTTRAYINTDGSTTWTAINTVA